MPNALNTDSQAQTQEQYKSIYLSGARNGLHDPLRNFHFRVTILGGTNLDSRKDIPAARVSGLRKATDVIEYRDGRDWLGTRKLPGHTRHDPVTIESGIFLDATIDTAQSWVDQLHRPDNATTTMVPDFRRQVEIRLLDQFTHAAVYMWTLLNAWVPEENWGDLDAAGNAVLMRSLAIQHEGLVPKPLSSSVDAILGTFGIK